MWPATMMNSSGFHHADPHSAKFKAKWYEFDIGWFYIRLLSLIGLAKVQYARGATRG